jgi:GT2 family glycosyltransferase/predicted SAM-dependent methyltransferase/tetratricopeptide (TPR) repeat protein
VNTAVIIVTYNSANTIAACLASVLAARQPGDELVVVDNASRDATPAILNGLAVSLPVIPITIIQNETNAGFAAAVNQGIKASRSPLVALLNPDTVVPDGWQNWLVSHFSEPQVAAVGPVSNFAAARQSVACHWQGPPPDGIGVQAAAERLHTVNAGCYETTPLLIGFCLLLRREPLEKLGGLDERLFLGNDDLELSWRLRLHGYELRIATDCFVYHEGQHSFHGDPVTVTGRLLRESSDALYDILEQHYGPGRVPPPSELWGIDWFEPSSPQFNHQVHFHQVLTKPVARGNIGNATRENRCSVNAHQRRLHIGGKQSKPGWEIFNAVPAENVTHLGDARDLSRFEDNTFSELYASNLLEHFDYLHDLMGVLKEWLRVLKPAGRIYLSVPDLAALSRLFLDKQLDASMRFQVMRAILGGHTDQHDYHLAAFDYDILYKYLVTAGFVAISRAEPFELFEDTSNYVMYGHTISLNVTAEKPGSADQQHRDVQITEDVLPLCQDAAIPLVSIIILSWNQRRYTEECLAALDRHTSEPHEVILVDNGSNDGTVDFLRNLAARDSRYRLIENRSNRGFAAGCNQGLVVARGKFLVLLNNDVVVTPGWLSGLLDCYSLDQCAGIVGPLTNNASGIQGLGPQEYGRAGLDAFARQFRNHNRQRRIPSRRLVGFCMLFSRQLYQEIGGLDERFGTGNYEDDDFCLRAAIAGYRNLIAGDVYLHHHGSVSFAGGGIDYCHTMNGNRSLFQEKWSAPVTERGEAARIARCRLREELEQLLLDEQYDEILVRLREVSEEEVADPLIRDIHAKTLWLKGRRAEAVSLLPAGSAAALTLQGCQALEIGDLKEAEAFLWTAISADPGFGAPYAYLAQLASQRGEVAYAADLLLRGVTLNPLLPDFEPLLEMIITQQRGLELVRILADAARLYPESRRVGRLVVDWSADAGLQSATVAAAEQFCVHFGCNERILATGLAARRGLGAYAGSAPEGQQTSLCMIVKDEERHLPHCLLSCRSLVQEMIVVDTGSKDHTAQLAELFGAKLLHHPWQDDFSSARNHSLAAAQSDWILIMDADERISPRDYLLFRKTLAETPPCGLVMETRNYTDLTTLDGFQANAGLYPEDEAGLGWTGSRKVRLFPNVPSVRFEGVVHETVDASILQAGLTLQPHPVPVHHYGGLEKDRQARKQQLYYLLGQRKAEQQRDLKAIYELAVQSGELGYWDEAERLWQELLGQEPGLAVAWFNLGYVLLRQGRMDDALNATERALAIQPDYPAAFVNLGICYFCLLPPETALGSLTDLIGRCPEDKTVCLLGALARCLAGRLPEGIAMLRNLQLSLNGTKDFISKLEEMLRQVGRDKDAVLLRHLEPLLD